MVHLLVDTSIWLGLAKGPKDLALIGVIEALVKQGAATIVVPEVVVAEFIANRERVAADHGKRFASHLRALRDAIEISNEIEQEAQQALQFLDKVDQESSIRRKFAERTFRRLERLLESARVIAPSPTVIASVYRRAIERKAPFHKGENEAADATIIETYAELSKDAAEGDKWFFVTRNTEHFSNDRGNKKEPHPDFDCFSIGRSEYFIDLPTALRAVDTTAVNEMLKAWEQEQPTVGELIERYLEEVPKKKAIGIDYLYRMAKIKRNPIAQKKAGKLQKRDIVEFCKYRREKEGAQPGTVLHDVLCLRTVLLTAENDWEILGVNANITEEATEELEEQGLVSQRRELSGRRPTEDEIDRLIKYFRKQNQHARTKHNMVDVMEFALATGRRVNEIYQLRWKDFDASSKTCALNGKTFPLLDSAVEIVSRQRQVDTHIFPHVSKTASARFTMAKKELGIKGLRFQDLRREAVCRMLVDNVPLDKIERLAGMGPTTLSRYRDQFLKAPTGDTGERKVWKRERTRRPRITRRR